jgi:hypothetical protein
LHNLPFRAGLERFSTFTNDIINTYVCFEVRFEVMQQALRSRRTKAGEPFSMVGLDSLEDFHGSTGCCLNAGHSVADARG